MAEWEVFKTCKICGEYFSPEELSLVDGKYYCNECFKSVEKDTTEIECEMCHELFPPDEIVTYRGRRYCKVCKQLVSEKTKSKKKGDKSKYEKEIERLNREIALIKETIDKILKEKEETTQTDTKLIMEKIRALIMGTTLRRVIDIVKQRFGWQQYDLKDFHDKNKNGKGFIAIVQKTSQTITDPMERKKMEIWARIFNRYARDGIAIHSEEIEAIMELLLSLIDSI